MERISNNLAIDLAVRLANTRAVWISTMRFLVDRGVLTEADMTEMRDCCLDASADFAIAGNGLKREFGLAGVRDMSALFESVLRIQPA